MDSSCIGLSVYGDKMDLTKLLSIVDDHFNREDIKTLCFDLGIDFDNLAGDTKEGKARELIWYMKRDGRLPQLIQYIREKRPLLSLEEMALDTVEAEPKSMPPLPTSLLNDIREKLLQRRLVLFIGADLPSTVTGVPARQTLAERLARQEDHPPGSSLAAVTQQIMQSGNRFRFTDFLRNQLDTTGKQPQPFHQYIVSLVQTYRLETLITTAYDDLLEMAFRQKQIGLNRIVTDADLRFMNPTQPTLIKLYGDWQRVDSLSVTQQDLNALLSGREKSEIVGEIRHIFRRYTLLFVGHDLNDPFVENLFDEVAGGKFQIPAYAIWPKATELEITSYKSNRGLTILATEPLDFINRLVQS